MNTNDKICKQTDSENNNNKNKIKERKRELTTLSLTEAANNVFNYEILMRSSLLGSSRELFLYDI